jgi:cobalamin biosynthesis protein CobT
MGCEISLMNNIDITFIMWVHILIIMRVEERLHMVADEPRDKTDIINLCLSHQ